MPPSAKDERTLPGIRARIGAVRSPDLTLLESESGYRALLERVPAVIYVERSLGNDGGAFQVVFVSSEVQTLLGYTVDEWRADPKLWASLVHPDDLERVLA